MIRIHGLRACDTCRKALKSLQADGHAATLRDIREDPLSDVELSRFFSAFGDELVNRRSTTWRGLSEAERARAPLDLLRDHPALMKRPVIETPETLRLGWSETVRNSIG